MPANLTPEYFKADKWYRSATSNDEKILAVEEMLRVIPKHKGTEHMRADLRRKLRKLKETGEKKSGTKTVDIFHVRRSGAGQIVLLGTPNCGKSAIVGALTNAKVNIANFPFATQTPVPGMVKFEDIQIQLVDMPPITADYSAPGQVGTYRHSDLIGLVIDLSTDVEEQMLICIDYLESKKLLKDDRTGEHDEHGNVLGREVFCFCTKSDKAQADAIGKVTRTCDERFECVTISTETGQGVEELRLKLFELLKIIRIYSKPPGQKADMKDPFILPVGSTVMDLAEAVHRQLAQKLKSARIWGTGVHPGQNVHKTHVLNDKDVVELHF
ncbi:MAG: GTPase [Planctomycetota bacterium]|jgi:ribosome-interacting GTPase 1